MWLTISDQLSPRLYLAPFPWYSMHLEVRNHPTIVWALRSRRRTSNFVIKLSWGIELHFSKNCMILTSAVLSQYTCVTRDKRHTDDRWHSQTLQRNCNIRTKSRKSVSSWHVFWRYNRWVYTLWKWLVEKVIFKPGVKKQEWSMARVVMTEVVIWNAQGG